MMLQGQPFKKYWMNHMNSLLMNNKPICLCICFLVVTYSSFSQLKDYTKYVNPFIGTEGTGHTFPGPSMPFGLVQPGPDNRDRGWDYTSGYQYKDSLIMGFSQTRSNGTGISEYGDILLQPFTAVNKAGLSETYIKSSEQATPGYYTVTLGNRVKVELTCTGRVAFHRYTYPTMKALLLVDLQHGLRFLTDSLVLESKVKIVNKTTIQGYCHTRNWVDRKYYFTIQFNKPFKTIYLLPGNPKENAPRYIVQFHLPEKTLLTKISLSTTAVEGATLNLNTELPGWDFNAAISNAKKVWNHYLSRIEIEAPFLQKQVFYTCLYRLFLQPANIADVDGKYRGADDSVRVAVNKEYYSTLSLWDTYRAAHPLYTILAPERVNGFIRSFMAHANATGFLPIWTAWGKDNYCMIGNHAIPVITDAYNKGFRGFDTTLALQQMIRSTTVNHINSNWQLLNRFGYYPFDSLDNESVSRTLEHGVDDYCIAVMAAKMGKKEIADQYFKRSLYYKHVYDPLTRQMRGKDSKGNWRTPFNPLTATSPMNNPGDYTEANAWQYFWTPAQYDIPGMMGLLGGKKQFTAQLDSFFTIRTPNPDKYLGQEAMIGQYAHGNEPSHHIAYLYAYSETPAKGQYYIHQVIRDFYKHTPDGMIGNDDCGQMSAWYILSVLGFYQVNPAVPSFVLSSPQVTKAILHLKNGKTFTVEAPAYSGRNIYASKYILNKIPVISIPALSYSAIMQGGRLWVQMQSR